MGWARTLLLGHIGNHLDIEDVEEEMEEIEEELEDVREELAKVRNLEENQAKAIQQLQKENAQLELCIAALVKALQKRGIVSEGEVKNLVNIIEHPSIHG